jgi:phosphoesterase RecJ-like protein
MIDSAALQQIQSLLQNGRKFLLTTHINADGDGIGSEIALTCYLRDLGKQAYIFNHSATPENLEFLDTRSDIQIFDPQKHNDLVRKWTLLSYSTSATGSACAISANSCALCPFPKFVSIIIRSTRMGDIDVILTDASSTGEITYDLLTKLGARLQGKIVEALYTAVLTDTGSFRFSNTNARAHEIAGDLVRRGIKPHQIYQEVYERQPANKMRLLGQILNNLNFAKDGRLVWFIVTQDMRKPPAQPRDTEGFADSAQ